MSMIVPMQVGDTTPLNIVAEMKDSTGTWVPAFTALSQIATVALELKTETGALILRAAANADASPTECVLRYDWSSGGNTVPGTFFVVFKVLGTNGVEYSFPNRDADAIGVEFGDGVPNSTPGSEPLAFTKTGLTVAELLEEDLYGVVIAARGEARPLPPAFFYQKLRAAEDFYERSLQTFFGVRRVVSSPIERGLVLGTDYDIAEPAYDWDPDAFTDNNWSFLRLGYRPVRDVTRLFFSFPGNDFKPSVTLDRKWIRLDQRLGQLELLPMGGPSSVVLLQLGAQAWTVLAGGRRVPQVLFIDYTAGITPADLRRSHADLLEGIRLRTLLLALPQLTNTRTGGITTQSLSLDGLSTSEGYGAGKWGPYSGVIEQAMAREQEIRDHWQQQEAGIPLLVV